MEITYFGISLFTALVLLAQWKRRKDLVAKRLNRGLTCYVEAKKQNKPKITADSYPDAMMASSQ
jgi:hypothetical protein